MVLESPGSNPRHAFTQLGDFGSASVFSSAKGDHHHLGSLWEASVRSQRICSIRNNSPAPPPSSAPRLRREWGGGCGLDSVSFETKSSTPRVAVSDPPNPSRYLRFSPPSEHWKSRPSGCELTKVCRWESSKARHRSASE